MNGDKISYADVREYESLFKLAPSFLLERFAKKNANVVLKFQSHIASHLSKLNETQKAKLEIILNSQTEEFNKELVIIPAYLAKGLEFDSVIVYSDGESKYLKNEKNLLYVACTRAQHELIVYSVNKK
jgi:DNA helicase IV